MAVKLITNFIAKALFKKKGAIANNKAVQFSANSLENRIINLGIDPRTIKNEKELNQILGLLKQAEDQAFADRFGSMLQKSRFGKPGEVVDMTGKKIDTSKGIMGGREIPETEVEIAERIKRENKEAVERFKKKMDDTDPENMATGGRAGFKSGSYLFKGLKSLGKKYRGSTLEALLENPKLLGTELGYEGLLEIFRMGGMMQDGGRAGFKFGLSKLLKEFMERRKFLKTMVGNTEKNKRARQLEMLKQAMEDARKNPGFEFPSGKELQTELEKKIGPILLKDRKLNAEGGRAGFKDGMSRRRFLQIMGGLGSIPIVGKFFKFGKAAKSVKAVPIVKTPPVEGKPAWFDSLVNKVIAEGEDVTKKFATKDREIVHVKALDDETTIYVHRDLDTGTVRVDVDDSVRNVKGEQEDALVSLEFKPGKADETTKGKPADTFTAVENDYRNYADGPDDYVTETVENSVTDTKDLTSDLTKIKLYAKGQEKPTLKEFIESKKRKEQVQYAEEQPSQYAADRGPDYDPDYYGDDYDYASGGIAGMLGE